MGSTDGRVEPRGGLGSPQRATSQEQRRGGRIAAEGGSIRKDHA